MAQESLVVLSVQRQELLESLKDTAMTEEQREKANYRLVRYKYMITNTFILLFAVSLFVAKNRSTA